MILRKTSARLGNQFRQIRPGNAKDLDRLADLLDVIVINLKEAGRREEFGNGSLYIKVQKKMTGPMLTSYNRWVFEQKKTECVESLREWIIQETDSCNRDTLWADRKKKR